MVKNRPPDSELIALYQEQGSVQKVGKILGIHGATIHVWLQKLGVNRKINLLTDDEKQQIEIFYEAGFLRADGTLDAFCKALKRTKPFISRYAKEAGLTNRKRVICDEGRAKTSKIFKAWHAVNEHPRGMLGKKHKEEAKPAMIAGALNQWQGLTPEEREAKIGKQYAGRIAAGSVTANYESSKARSWKGGWRVIAGKRSFYRSRWEANYARVLQWQLENGQILDWEHEPDRFQFSNPEEGCRSYLPDFKVATAEGSTYHEVKGWFDDRTKAIFRLMKAEYPDIKITVIDGSWFKANKHFKQFINDWE